MCDQKMHARRTLGDDAPAALVVAIDAHRPAVVRACCVTGDLLAEQPAVVGSA